MNRDKQPTAVYVRSPYNGDLRTCDYSPRFNTWLCGACHRGWLNQFSDACPSCAAEVTKVETDDDKPRTRRAGA